MAMDIETLVRRNKDQLALLEQQLSYRFTDLRLLQKAMIHSSFAFEQAQIGNNNEILEFLGDAVLDLVIGHTLCKKFPEMREGELTRFRSSLVNETHLANMARELNLGDYLCLGKGEDASNGRNKSSILSCAYEAMIGALFEDSDYATVEQIINSFFIPAMAAKKEELLMADAKSRLQESLQETFNEAPSYRLDNEEGPSHQKVFTVSVIFRDTPLGTGTASSKKVAEQRAAAATLNELEDIIVRFSE